MARWHFGTQTYPVTTETRWRHRFTLLSVCVAVLLISWGGLVTSIDAGLAVPDWPASFGSYDPFKTGFEDPTDPNARWWHRLPILAEHGHRLIGALMGILTIILALWTWRADPRRWMRNLGFAALGLVVVQGILGGLRVVWVSLDLAVVHACTAQIFFALLVAMTLFTSKSWLRADSVPPRSPATRRLTGLAIATVGLLYVQIILGALLRHPGAGVHPLFVVIHITGAFVVLGLVVSVFLTVRTHFEEQRLLRRGSAFMMSLVLLQIVLGFSAYAVLLYETSMARRSVIQVVLNSTHLVIGALLMATAVSTALLALRRPTTSASSPPE
ncbi:MAG: cytochrome oxidase assembly protein, partial [Bacteroidetes bacterium]|nr:cytochrome oxidase assembly protein [Bacteroidota bacterium]